MSDQPHNQKHLMTLGGLLASAGPPDRRVRLQTGWLVGVGLFVGVSVGYLAATVGPDSRVVPIPMGAGEKAVLLRDYARAIEDRNALIANLKQHVTTLNERLRTHDAALAATQAHGETMVPDQTIAHHAQTEEGLRHETIRILGEFGIRHVAVVERPSGSR